MVATGAIEKLRPLLSEKNAVTPLLRPLYDLYSFHLLPMIGQIVTGDRDPGYGSTSKMVAETALCLLDHPDGTGGGMWTPGAMLGEKLTERLVGHAGLTVTVSSDIER